MPMLKALRSSKGVGTRSGTLRRSRDLIRHPCPPDCEQPKSVLVIMRQFKYQSLGGRRLPPVPWPLDKAFFHPLQGLQIELPRLRPDRRSRHKHLCMHRAPDLVRHRSKA